MATGLKSAALTRTLDSSSLPSWMLKWAALVLDYIEEEERELPAMLTKLGANNQVQYTDLSPKCMRGRC